MAAIFELSITSETLTADEVAEITGCCRNGDQAEWLKRNGWTFYKNKNGAPVVGRLYARLTLSGINPQTLAANSGWNLDLSQVK